MVGLPFARRRESRVAATREPQEEQHDEASPDSQQQQQQQQQQQSHDSQFSRRWSHLSITSRRKSLHLPNHAAHTPHLSKVNFFRDAIRIKGSCLPLILPSVLGVTLWATLIYSADHFFDRKWKTSSAIVGPLSVVVGLLLVFRNSTSYDRWYEARKLWAQSVADAASLARWIWINVDVQMSSADLSAAAADGSDTACSKASPADIHRRLEKKRKTIRLFTFYFHAVAHELRKEPGIDWPDYQDVMPDEMRRMYMTHRQRSIDHKYRNRRTHDTLRSLPPEAIGTLKQRGTSKGSNGTNRRAPQQGEQSGNVHDVEAGTGNNHDTEATPLLDSNLSEMLRSEPASTDLSLPLCALHEIARYLSAARRAKMLTDAGPAGYSLAHSLVNSLTAHRASLLRIRDGTIPLAYNLHLKQCTLFYLLALPLTLVSELGWKMIPFTTLVAVTLLGVVGISSELEVPYGDDASDHDLALFCRELRDEMEGMMQSAVEGLRRDDVEEACM